MVLGEGCLFANFVIKICQSIIKNDNFCYITVAGNIFPIIAIVYEFGIHLQ